MLLGEHKRGQCNESRIGQCTELSEPKPAEAYVKWSGADAKSIL